MLLYKYETHFFQCTGEISGLARQCLKTVLAPYFLILITACNISTSYATSDSHTNKLDSKTLRGLQSGQYVILLRHALAPGFGDPDKFNINDCSTQRNLSDKGREQAKRIGKLLKTNGIEHADVYSSQWCRCLETAHLLDFGNVIELSIANSFFRKIKRKPQQTEALRTWLIDKKTTNKNKSTNPIIVVTHQVNITALIDIFPRSGELAIVDIDNTENINIVALVRTDN